MPVPTTLASLSTTAASNSPGGGENPFPDLDDHIRAGYAFDAQNRDAIAAKLNASAVSAFGLTLIDDADAATARATLGAVGLTGDQTVAGVKTFSSSPLLPGNATQDLHPLPRQQLRSTIGSGFSGLSASATGANSLVSVAANEVVVRNTSGDPALLTGVSLSINSAASGANGLDTGAVASNTWYAIWVIWNGTTTAGLLSLSGTAPTMPSGYTHKARVGWTRTASSNPMAFKQFGRRVRWINTGSGLPSMAGGASAGNPFSPTWVSVSTLNYAPTTAGSISVLLCSSGGPSGQAIVAPSSTYGAINSISNPPPIAYSTPSSSNQNLVFVHDITLESTDIQWAHSGNFYLFAHGWEDNV